MIRKKSVKKKSASVKVSAGVNKGLVKNFVELQKVMTIQSMKIDKLTTQISGLLNLFSSSAKALAKKEFGAGKSEEIAKLNDKLDSLFTETQKMSKGVMDNASREPEPMYSPSMESSAPIPVQAQAPVQAVAPVQAQIPVQAVAPVQVPVQAVVSQGQVNNGQVVQGSIQPSTKEA